MGLPEIGLRTVAEWVKQYRSPFPTMREGTMHAMYSAYCKKHKLKSMPSGLAFFALLQRLGFTVGKPTELQIKTKVKAGDLGARVSYIQPATYKTVRSYAIAIAYRTSLSRTVASWMIRHRFGNNLENSRDTFIAYKAYCNRRKKPITHTDDTLGDELLRCGVFSSMHSTSNLLGASYKVAPEYMRG
jgi:hypothetical protein